MSYYHEARAHVKALKQMTEDNKRRQERRAELYEAQNEHPLHDLRLDGRSCALHVNNEQYHSIERMEGLIPWQGGAGGEENLIDRFDCRAMLDMYVPPRSTVRKPKTDEEEELDEMVNFESYRDLIPLAQKRLADEQGILEAEKQNVTIRAAARTAATASAGVIDRPSMPADSPAFPASLGAVGFQYGGEVGGSSSSEEGSGSDMELEEEAEAIGTAIAPASDEVAKEFGLGNFEVLLRRELKREEAEGLWQKKPRKKHKSRKKFAERARRMAGQGLDPYSGMKKMESLPYRMRDDRGPLADRDFTFHRERGSPEYDAYHGKGEEKGSGKGRDSRRSGKEQKVEFITEFAIGEQSAPTVQPYVEADAPTERRPAQKPAIRDAMPSQMDPGVEGPVALPTAGSTVHGIRATDLMDREAQLERERRAAERARERGTGSRDGGYGGRRGAGRRSRSSSRSRSRSRSRDRYRRRRSKEGGRGRSGSRSSSPSRDRRHDRSGRRRGGSERRSRSRSPERRRGRERSRSRSPDDKRRERKRIADRKSSPAGRDRDDRRSEQKAEGKATKGEGSAASGSAGKETPAQRMKRIMAAQLDKQVQKAKLTSTQRKVQEEKDRVAREQQQRAAGLFGGRRF